MTAAAFLAATLVPSFAAAQASDPFQRSFTIKNSLPIPIYPVIQAPQDRNCGTGGLYRIIVNDGAEGRGMPPASVVTVRLPKTQPCTNKRAPFYDAARVYVSVAPITAYEGVLDTLQRTVRDNNWDYAQDPLCAGCWFGKASNDYGLDGPHQLIEYTVISLNPATGDKWDDPNDTRGIPMIDFDVSYVDHSYLPVAMALADGGATQFMGSMLDHPTFNARMAAFVPAAQWSLFGSYRPEQWAGPAECPSPTGAPTRVTATVFSCMVGRTDRVPSAAGLMSSLHDTSQYYWPVYDPQTSPPRQCGAADNLQCSAPVAEGGSGLDPNNNCCPNDAGQTVGCCAMQNFIVAGTRYWWHNRSSFGYQNTTVDAVVQRFTNWRRATAPCADPSAPAVAQAPVADKVGFCNAFKRTVDYVWSEFRKQCQTPARGAAHDRCVTTAIIGYDLKNSGFDPEACKSVCPGPNCPGTCVAEKLRTESVQALQRSVPWMPFGDPANCGGCPSADAGMCNSACIDPQVPSPNATIYHYDKFLHFWAGYDSPYNLNPYATFVHDTKNGLASPGAYSFSIDDFYGNFGGRGSGLVIEVGGTSAMPNPEAYDPYQQYAAAFGSGWHHVTVCGRRYAPPPGSEGRPFSVPVSFWNEGVRLPECIVKAFAAEDETDQFIVFRLVEVPYTIHDRYSDQDRSVRGLGGVYAYRGQSDPIPADDYCTSNSKSMDASLCTANLTAGGSNLDYVALSNDACTAGKERDATCGKPLIALAVPSRP